MAMLTNTTTFGGLKQRKHTTCKTDYTSARLEVFKNRVLSRVYGPKRMQLTDGEQNRMKKSFVQLYSSPNITTVITSRMKLAERVKILRRYVLAFR